MSNFTTVTEQPRPQQFDERAALEELERLAEKIQSSRQQRAKAVEEFDAFVRGFRIENRTKAAQAAERAARAPEQLPPIPAPPRAPLPDEDRASVRSPDWSIAPASAPRAVNAALLSQSWVLWAAAAVAALLLVTLVLSMRSRPPSASESTTPVAAAPDAATPPAAAPAPAPVVPPAPQRALNIELLTIRPVWTRVTADDQRVIERELPGGQRIRLGADRDISIRAGDAGAIRLVVDGTDVGTLGRDGQIANRTFAAKGK